MAETPCPSSRVPRHLPRALHPKEKEERQPRAAAALWSGPAAGVGELLPSPLPSRVTRGVAGKVQAREIQTGRWREAGRDVTPIDWRELKPCIPSVDVTPIDWRELKPCIPSVEVLDSFSFFSVLSLTLPTIYPATSSFPSLHSFFSKESSNSHLGSGAKQLCSIPALPLTGYDSLNQVIRLPSNTSHALLWGLMILPGLGWSRQHVTACMEC